MTRGLGRERRLTQSCRHRFFLGSLDGSNLLEIERGASESGKLERVFVKDQQTQIQVCWANTGREMRPTCLRRSIFEVTLEALVYLRDGLPSITRGQTSATPTRPAYSPCEILSLLPSPNRCLQRVTYIYAKKGRDSHHVSPGLGTGCRSPCTATRPASKRWRVAHGPHTHPGNSLCACPPSRPPSRTGPGPRGSRREGGCT